MKKGVFLVIFLVISISLGYFYQRGLLGRLIKKQDHIVYQANFIETFSKFLSDQWRNPENLAKECLPKGIPSDQLACHPDIFQCSLEKSSKVLRYQGKKIKYQNTDFSLVSTAPEKIYQAEFLIDGHKTSYFFKDQCREVYLPQRNYRFFISGRKIKTEWDNFSKNIFIDKFRVKNWQVIEWAGLTDRVDILKKYELRPRFETAVNLSRKDMERFCQTFGKGLLEAKVYDALTIFPEEINNPKTKLLRAPFYYWTRRNSSTKLYQLQTGEELDKTEKLELCKKVKASDCKEDRVLNFTWMGIAETDGGEFEYLRNPENPSENIVLSSSYFPLKSKVHRTGVRGYWSENSISINDFTFKGYADSLSESDFKISFRCMRRK